MQKLAFIRRRRSGVCVNDEHGQTMIFVVVGLAVVLLAIVGFAVDYGNIWFRRQHAQSAADAACTAAVMDMLNNITLGTTGTGGFADGTDFDCGGGSNSIPTSAPCQYAALDGYNGTGLVAGTESNKVEFTFSDTLDGNPIPDCDKNHPEIKVCKPPGSVVAKPFVQAKITNNLKATFFGMLTSANTVAVPAKASCGLVLASSPIPLLVLDKSRDSTLTSNGGGSISIYGGPARSIQVNSTSTSSLDWNGNKLQIDLHLGGGSLTGSSFGVTGVQSAVPSTSTTAGCVAPPSGPDICLGTTGAYQPGVRPIPDPFASIEAPDIPTTVIGTRTTGIPSGTKGCPALPTTRTCVEYSPGYYDGTPGHKLSLAGEYAIFDPGIYYVVGGLDFGSNSCVRPAAVPGDGSGGTFFYFADGNSISVPANTGCNTNSQTTATNFNATDGGGIGAPYTLGVRCDSSSAAIPANLAAAPDITGSVLLAPCVAPTVTSLCTPNCTKNGGFGYGDPFGTADPAGTSRGLLMMQNRGIALASNKMPSWQGGGSFLLSGSIYFHQCGTSGNDTPGLSCPASAYTTQLEFGGNATGTSYVLGNIITDQLKIHGSSGVNMDLSPNATYFIYKASLLQ
jgi:hypothetical protein